MEVEEDPSESPMGPGCGTVGVGAKLSRRSLAIVDVVGVGVVGTTTGFAGDFDGQEALT